MDIAGYIKSKYCRGSASLHEPLPLFVVFLKVAKILAKRTVADLFLSFFFSELYLQYVR